MNCSSVSVLSSLDLRPRFLLLAALTCAIPALADTVVIRGDRVNVRSQPSLDGEVLVWMKRGETVETQGSSKDGFIRIALPSKVAVWVYGPLVDRASHQIKAPEARLRVGPGRNYGELGVLKKGAALTEIRESDGWLQVEPPAGLSATSAPSSSKFQALRRPSSRRSRPVGSSRQRVIRFLVIRFRWPFLIRSDRSPPHSLWLPCRHCRHRRPRWPFRQLRLRFQWPWRSIRFCLALRHLRQPPENGLVTSLSRRSNILLKRFAS